MIKHFSDYTWETVEKHIYKENPDVFQDVTKQVLFEHEGDLPVQFRYFEVGTGGFSSLEKHQHMHMVVIFRGEGHVLLGKHVHAVSKGDLIVIHPWEWHQFRADEGEKLGFFCLVNADRDIPVYPSREDLQDMHDDPQVDAFLQGQAGGREKDQSK